ncbi:NAD-dependent succinate-semialdehyde dehydrogenase [Caulobacter segnis]|uniref:NAD-dependent succinate-semialdehyde dehydrogenase n=1 Tax=Caulobacter segnis TaxID=88688 RepID=UPI001CBBDDF9|nr:NAD-dependent succinate-semialdehyde dehydrogenase [Caulobacter segnis]UAL12571.1 NAD-dependent succinate-semialdehyde dehydrogenase [Caulobacter segnis]
MVTTTEARRTTLARPDLLRSQAYYAGAWRDAASGETIAVTDPFSGETLAQVALVGEGEIQAAIAAAEAAFPRWSRTPHRERGALLRRWLELIERDKEDLARLITLENGKPLKEARAEVAYGAGFIEIYAEMAAGVLGEIIPPNAPGRRLLVEREPIGVCAAITPWNFPMAMLTRKIAPALAAGCVMVCKPASETPLTALALAALAEEAGIPPGVLSVLVSTPALFGDIVTASSAVRKITFTGSTGVGAKLMAASAPTIKRLSLELGGNAPLLIFDDADLDTAVETAMVAKFRNGGQSCIAANRIYVQRGVYEAFLAAFQARIGALKVGDGLDPATDIGPLISGRAVEKVERHLDEALAGGGRLVHGGRGDGSLLSPPTLVADVASDALLTREETFGPLAGVIPFKTYDQAIARANDTPFGLAAYVCSSRPDTIAQAGRDLETGMVGINTGLISTAAAPFGGVKSSGVGREGSHHGLSEYLNYKYLCQAGL